MRFLLFFLVLINSYGSTRDTITIYPAMEQILELKGSRFYEGNSDISKFGIVQNSSGDDIGIMVDPKWFDENRDASNELLIIASLDFLTSTISEVNANLTLIDSVTTSMLGEFDKYKKIIDEANRLYTAGTASANVLSKRDYAGQVIEVIKIALQDIKNHQKENAPEGALNQFLSSTAWTYYEPILLASLEGAFKVVDGAKIESPDDIVGIIKNIVTAAIDTKRIFTALNGISDIQEENKRNLVAVMVSEFIGDYVREYNQNLLNMRSEIHRYSQEHSTTTETEVGNFWQLFKAYIRIRETDESTKYFGGGHKIDNNVFHILSNSIDEELIYIAAEKAIELIENYGNGGLFSIPLKPKVDIMTKRYTVTNYETTMNQHSAKLLYAFPKKGQTLERVICLPKPNISQYINSITEPLLYDVYYPGTQPIIKSKSLHLVNPNRYAMTCSFQYKNLSENEDKSIFYQVYIPEVFPDIKDLRFWGLKYIGELLNKQVIQGDENGNFNAQNDVTVGEFLKMITRIIYAEQRNFGKDTNSIAFSKYKTFLEGKGVDISMDDGTSLLTAIANNNSAKRGYVAKVAVNLLKKAYDSPQLTKCEALNSVSDWDSCSDLLEKLDIVGGNAVDGQYHPNDNISRAEVTKVIYNTWKTYNKIDGSKR